MTFRQVLAELELLSHGTTQAFNSSGIAAERDPRPSGEANPPHLTFRQQWDDAVDDEARERVHAEAVGYLLEWRGQLKPAPVRELDLRGDVLRMAGFTPKEIANRLGGIVSQGQVIGWRGDAGLCVSTGYPRVEDEPTRVRALRLWGQGLTASQIALSCGVSRQAISQLLKRAA